MFLRASFSAWFNLLKKHQREEIEKRYPEEDERNAALRSAGFDPKQQNDDAEKCQVDIEHESEFSITDSEDDLDIDDGRTSSKHPDPSRFGGSEMNTNI